MVSGGRRGGSVLVVSCESRMWLRLAPCFRSSVAFSAPMPAPRTWRSNSSPAACTQRSDLLCTQPSPGRVSLQRSWWLEGQHVLGVPLRAGGLRRSPGLTPADAEDGEHLLRAVPCDVFLCEQLNPESCHLPKTSRKRCDLQTARALFLSPLAVRAALPCMKGPRSAARRCQQPVCVYHGCCVGR